MTKIIHAQTELPPEVVAALKYKTGEPSVKDAIYEAVQHYLKCEYIDDPTGMKEGKRYGQPK